jgi:hypothetical protein
MTSQRSHWMMLSLSRDVCGMGFFGRGKGSEVDVSAINLDARLPLAFTKPPCAHQARSAVASRFSLVLAIFSGRDITKIDQAVVVCDAINVVNVSGRPDAVDVKPSKSVSAVLPPFKAYASVALRERNKSSFGSCFCKLVARNAIPKNARFRVVMQKVFKLRLGDSISGFSHVIAPSQRSIGQRIEGVTSTFFPRFNIEGIA